MADATYNLIRPLGQYGAQTPRHFTITKIVDTADSNIGAGESADFCNTPATAVVTSVTAVELTAEGGTLTVDIGDEADPDGYLDGGNANVTAPAVIAKAGTEAYAGGKYYATATPLRIVCVNAADAAKIAITVEGYTLDV
jgi:hypothetical protein